MGNYLGATIWAWSVRLEIIQAIMPGGEKKKLKFISFMLQIPLASTNKLRCVKFYLARDKISKFLSKFSLDFNFDVKNVAENGDLNNNKPSTDHVWLACVAVFPFVFRQAGVARGHGDRGNKNIVAGGRGMEGKDNDKDKVGMEFSFLFHLSPLPVRN